MSVYGYTLFYSVIHVTVVIIKNDVITCTLNQTPTLVTCSKLGLIIITKKKCCFNLTKK